MLKFNLLKNVKTYGSEFHNKLNSNEHGFIIQMYEDKKAEIRYIHNNTYKIFNEHISEVLIEDFSELYKDIPFFSDKYMLFNGEFIPQLGVIDFTSNNIELFKIIHNLNKTNKSIKILVKNLDNTFIVHKTTIMLITGIFPYKVSMCIYETRES